MRAYRVLLPVAFASVLVLSGCRRAHDTRSSEPEVTIPVHTAVAELTTEVRTQDVAGTVRPLARAIVSARVMGKVARADFAIGQRVAAGELLVSLDAEETAARLLQADAVLEQARRDHTRESALLAKGVATSEGVRTLADRLRIVEAARAEAQALRDYTAVSAPFDGVITRKFINAGDLAVPGTALFAIEGSTDLRAEVEVPDSLPLPSSAASLRVRLPAGEVDGSLVELSPAADPATRTRLAKISLPAAAPARSGDFARVAWPVGESAAITVPAAALSVMGQMERVFVVTEGRAILRIVKTAGVTADRVRIAAGLDAGELVVITPSASLRDGQAVQNQP